jgi:glucose-6-phosphate 1-dehydrogenase
VTETSAPASPPAALSRRAANPFAQDVAERTPEPTTLVIFGAAGDLTARKLLPAVYNLGVSGQLPETFRLIGLGRGADRRSFHATAKEAIAEHSRTGLDDAAFATLADQLDYVAGDFDDPKLFHSLADRLDEDDRKGGTPTRRMFYLATAPSFFGPIATGLAAAGLGERADPPTRLVVEKPFGHDLASAQQLNHTLQSAFAESQIFRIDHYLGKETVQNLMVWRFANGIFEPLWNRSFVDCVQITVAESLGIGHRAGYYDHSGAIRDIVQNHMLQLVALVGMEPPVAFEANLIRDEKVKLLRSVKVKDAAHVDDDVIRAQYRAGFVGGEHVVGYRDEEGVPDDSRTGTYVALRLDVDNWRWAGTPFYLRTGKRLPQQTTEIAVRFRAVPHLAFHADAQDVVPNELVLSIQPQEGATLQTVAKVPGTTMSLRPVQMDFQYGASFLSASPEAYERLLRDAMIGDATLFTRADEVETAWRIVDPILSRWAATDAEPKLYDAGTAGPPAADALLARDGRTWRPL